MRKYALSLVGISLLCIAAMFIYGHAKDQFQQQFETWWLRVSMFIGGLSCIAAGMIQLQLLRSSDEFILGQSMAYLTRKGVFGPESLRTAFLPRYGDADVKTRIQA